MVELGGRRWFLWLTLVITVDGNKQPSFDGKVRETEKNKERGQIKTKKFVYKHCD